MKRLRVAGVVVVALVAGLQVAPIGQPRSNPAATHEPEWSSPETRELFYRTCGDCHSNETRWPWYSKVAPVSWIITERVSHARSHLNVSEFSPARHGEAAAEATAELLSGAMPPAAYLRMNPAARLDDAERERLVRGLEAMAEFEPAH